MGEGPFGKDFTDCVSCLALRAGRAPRARARGLHASSGCGDSMEFQDYREYLPGDDLRRVDWNVYRRHGKLLLRRYRLHPARTLRVKLDCSRSISLEEPRRRAALRACAALSAVSLASGDKVEIELSKARPPLRFAPGPDALPILLTRLEREAAAALEEPFALDGELLHAGARDSSLPFVVSDFLWPLSLDSFEKALASAPPFVPLRVFSPEDLAPSFKGALQLKDSESGDELSIELDEALALRYKAALGRFLSALDAFAARCGARHLSIDASKGARAQLEDIFPFGVLEASA